MMFRIHFNSRGAFWCIQFSRFGLLWDTLCKHREVVKFDTHHDADQYVIDRGIETAYAQWLEPSVRAQRALEASATPVPAFDGKTSPAASPGLDDHLSEGDFLRMLTGAPQMRVGV